MLSDFKSASSSLNPFSKSSAHHRTALLVLTLIIDPVSLIALLIHGFLYSFLAYEISLTTGSLISSCIFYSLCSFDTDLFPDHFHFVSLTMCLFSLIICKKNASICFALSLLMISVVNQKLYALSPYCFQSSA